ncbi:FAD-binding protein [Mesorhizobium sp. M0833]|uniref:FAD-binding protein n=1 Tax=Mesorhizobium sp. M0833 TaxID=2957009 RepID=UPI003336ECEF
MKRLTRSPEPVLLFVQDTARIEASSVWAQGGLAASLGVDDDPVLHLADTLAAGDRLYDAEIVSASSMPLRTRLGPWQTLGPASIERLKEHCCWDWRPRTAASASFMPAATAAVQEIMRALVEAVRSHPSIVVIEGVEARRLAVEDNTVRGVWASCSMNPVFLGTGRVVLATGGDWPPVPRHDKPARQLRTGAGACGARVRSLPTWNSSSFIRRRSTGRIARCR